MSIVNLLIDDKLVWVFFFMFLKGSYAENLMYLCQFLACHVNFLQKRVFICTCIWALLFTKRVCDEFVLNCFRIEIWIKLPRSIVNQRWCTHIAVNAPQTMNIVLPDIIYRSYTPPNPRLTNRKLPQNLET